MLRLFVNGSLSLAVAAACVVTTPAFAKKSFAERHPRRAQVNRRERNQQRRINKGLKNGQLTQSQAKELRTEEAGIKAQERAEVKANGGYLTKDEQHQLNRELTAESQKIHQEKVDSGVR